MNNIKHNIVCNKRFWPCQILQFRHTSLGLLVVKFGRMSVILFRIYDQTVLWLFFFLPQLVLQPNGDYSLACLATKWRLFHYLSCYKMALVSLLALLQNGACFTTCLATKWRLFHYLPCYKMALVSLLVLLKKWRLFHYLPCYKMALVSLLSLLQNGACFTTCLATKWRLFHYLPCYKMALVSRIALPQNGSYSRPAFTFT